MRIELNYQAESLEEAICQAIVAYLGYEMSPREIVDQLIARGFIRDPGNNALEDVGNKRLAWFCHQQTQFPERTGKHGSCNPAASLYNYLAAASFSASPHEPKRAQHRIA